MTDTPPLLLPFAEISQDDVPVVGGKNASLGEMIRELGGRGVRVPDGFAVTAAAFRRHLEQAGLTESINRELEALDHRDTRELARVAADIRRRVREAPLPEDVAAAIREAYAALSAAAGDAAEPATEDEGLHVAVRSSATAEDLPTASFAGQQETYLHIRGFRGLDAAVRACMASLYTDRAIVYRAEYGFAHRDVALSVGVQRMVRSGAASAGTMFTLDPESGFRGVVVIDGAWGLGESVVQGRVTPDEWIVHKAGCRAGHRAIVDCRVAEKPVRLVPVEPPAGEPVAAGDATIREEPVPEADRRRPVLEDAEVLQLATWAMTIEEHATARAGRDTPMDIEWARDAPTGELFIVQARPETVHSRETGEVLETFRVRGITGEPLVRGKAVGNRAAAGPVRVVHDASDLHGFPDGAVLVTEMTDPDWEPVLSRAAAVVTDTGGRTCHAAIVSRELGLPCVVGCGDATTRLEDGAMVTVVCSAGDEGQVHAGRLEIERTRLDLAALPESPVPLMLNLADPRRAFQLASLPAAGVGLLRTEFIVTNAVGVHPMALAHPERVTDPADREAIAARIREAGGDPRDPAAHAEHLVRRLAFGVGRIAAAMHPRPVIVRFSDFKSNEYRHLLGGRDFEESEENPMIGFRGASRYGDAERYRDGFALECAAIDRVRRDMGLDNVKVMIPFCRTLGEADGVLATMKACGLPRGGNGLEVYVMCEIPSNALLAAEFAERFDGFSIGSNDLTQLTLGVDRDSGLLQHLFDERDPAVTALIRMVIAGAHAAGRPVGICGEAPSNHPDFARWLLEAGIDSMSLNPDALPTVITTLAEAAGEAAAATKSTREPATAGG
ncbi:MAG: phosphoenolpyruvate synthase [Planctomycetota bacterium]|jgi:pyruvate,water dikinase